MVPCSSVQSAFDSIKTMAEMAGTTHGSPPTGTGSMAPTARRAPDSKWKVQRKMMDQ